MFILDNEVLLITESEVIKILTMEDTLESVEEAFSEKARGHVQMPPKTYVTFEKYCGDFRTMPSFLETLDIAGVKVVNAHPNNPRLYDKPTVMATIMLIDPRSGTLLSIMGGTHITAMRTGAASGLATKYLAGPSSRILGLIGTGAQSRTQLLAISKVINLNEVRAYDVSKEALSKFVKETEEEYNVKVTSCKSVDECVKNSDVICTLTPSTSPIVKKEWVHPGMHINAIGADASGKQELDPTILKTSKIIVDDLHQTLHCGEINVPISQGILREEDIYAELGEIIIGTKPGRLHSEEITVFDSTGISLQDISTAHKVFKKAKAEKIGKWITL